MSYPTDPRVQDVRKRLHEALERSAAPTDAAAAKLASQHQILFEDLPAVSVALGGPLTVTLADGTAINVNLVAADADSDGLISQTEIARAINVAPENQGRVTASVTTLNGTSQLLLSSGKTGAAGAITVDASALPASPLRDALSASRELSAARDAVIWFGGQSGVRVQQATNTFTGIPGVTVEFTKAMAATDPAATLTVAADSGATAANVRKFVDAYNALETALDDLTRTGNTSTGAKAAPFATDAGVRTLRSRLAGIVRQEFGGHTLAEFGLRIDRAGQMSLDTARLEKQLAATPTALDTVLGDASLTKSSGVLGAFDRYVDVWLDRSNGLVAKRQANVESVQKSLAARRARLDAQYEEAYQRYLKQFTQLQTLESQMNQTAGLFQTAATA